MTSYILPSLFGVIALAGHFSLCYWLFGMTAAIVWTAIQFVLAIWMTYELIRAPVYDD